MTLIELSGLVSVICAAIAALLADGHSGVLSRVAAFFGGGVLGLAVYLCAWVSPQDHWRGLVHRSPVSPRELDCNGHLPSAYC
ncbi:MAG: hypothetical protein ACYTGL_29605 [Planctomycetota bacterium]|jgi:hypothetical protein